MSDENSSGTNSVDEALDMKQSGFSLFILKTKSSSLKSAEQFLINRNWKIGSGTGLKEALAYIIQKQPEFIMIAADHPHKKVKILPKILAQAFPVKIIAYSDAQSGAALGSLREFGVEYTVFPPVSGPAIERTVLKMKRDEEKRAQERKEREAMGLDPNSSADDLIRLKGEDNNSTGSASGYSQTSEQARAALSQLLSGDEDSSTSGMAYTGNLGQEPSANGQTSSAQGLAYTGSSLGEQNSKTNELSGISGSDQSQQGPNSNYARNADPSSDQKQNNHELNPSPTWLNPDGASNWDGKHDKDQIGHNSLDEDNQKNNDSYDEKTSGKRLWQQQDHAPRMDYNASELRKPLKPTYKSDPYSDQRNNDSIIVRGTQETLEQSVNHRTDIHSYQEIEKTSNCACIIVESERFSGYLVAALGKNRSFDQNFVEQIRIKLFQFLRSNGETIKEDASMNIKLETVDFEDWAIEQAEFLRKSIHDGDEIAMAFFPRQDVNITLEESAAQDMLKMDISEIKDDTVVEFDLYIHMPENNKYILYTPEGKTLYGMQRTRLVNKGVSHMHLKKDSAHNVKKYRAQNYLNEKIKAFQAVTRQKEA